MRDVQFKEHCHELHVDIDVDIKPTYALVTFKLLAYFSTMMTCFCSVKIFYSSKCRWKEGPDNMTISQIEWTLNSGIPRHETVSPKPFDEQESFILKTNSTAYTMTTLKLAGRLPSNGMLGLC